MNFRIATTDLLQPEVLSVLSQNQHWPAAFTDLLEEFERRLQTYTLKHSAVHTSRAIFAELCLSSSGITIYVPQKPDWDEFLEQRKIFQYSEQPGHTLADTAAHFGISTSEVSRCCKMQAQCFEGDFRQADKVKWPVILTCLLNRLEPSVQEAAPEIKDALIEEFLDTFSFMGCGRGIYLPQVMTIRRLITRILLTQDFDGTNITFLRKKYGLSSQTIYRHLRSYRDERRSAWVN